MDKPKLNEQQLKRANAIHKVTKQLGVYQRGDEIRYLDSDEFQLERTDYRGKPPRFVNVPGKVFRAAFDAWLRRTRIASNGEILAKENTAILSEPEFVSVRKRFEQTSVKNPEKPRTKLRKGSPNSKKQLVPKLPWDWRESIWEIQDEITARQSGKNKGSIQTALAVVTATGLRPEELQNGVELIKLDDGGVGVVIKGAKFSRGKGHDRGIESRTIGIDMKKPWGKHLAMQLEGGLTQFSYKKTLLRNKVNALGKTYLSQVKKKALDGASISPYAFRHAMGSDLKSSSLDPVKQSQIMGHLSTKSLQKYGKKRRGSGNEPAPVSLIKASDTPSEKPQGRLEAVLSKNHKQPVPR